MVRRKKKYPSSLHAFNIHTAQYHNQMLTTKLYSTILDPDTHANYLTGSPKTMCEAIKQKQQKNPHKQTGTLKRAQNLLLQKMLQKLADFDGYIYVIIITFHKCVKK